MGIRAKAGLSSLPAEREVKEDFIKRSILNFYIKDAEVVDWSFELVPQPVEVQSSNDIAVF